MLLVVSPRPESLATIAVNLRSRQSDPVVAVDRIEAALRVLESNPIRCLILDVRDSGRAWLRSFGRRISNTPCLVIGAQQGDVAELGAFLPNDAKFLFGPDDWDLLARALEPIQRETHDDPSGVIAVGLEDILSLLMMTGADASVQVSAGRNRGQLYLSAGHVVHAERESRSGDAVAYEIASWLEPEVTSKGMAADELPKTMFMSVHTLLCEVARRSDEIQRLPSLPEVQSIFDDLGVTTGFLGAVLTHVDNGQTIMTRGTGAHVHPDLLHILSRGPKFWPEGGKNSDNKGGLVQWSSEQMTVLVSVTSQLSLSVAFANAKLRTTLCDVVVNAASTLRELVEASFSGTKPAVANDHFRRIG